MTWVSSLPPSFPPSHPPSLPPSPKLNSLSVGDTVRCEVDYERRGKVAPNHTMTHVLNYALRKAVGSEVDQKGSLVTAEKLRCGPAPPLGRNTGGTVV